MVVVSCADSNDYIANITSVQEGHKTAIVHFYVDDPQNPGVGRHVRESSGHSSLYSIAWNCIKGLAEGHWGEMCGSNNLHSGKQVIIIIVII